MWQIPHEKSIGYVNCCLYDCSILNKVNASFGIVCVEWAMQSEKFVLTNNVLWSNFSLYPLINHVYILYHGFINIHRTNRIHTPFNLQHFFALPFINQTFILKHTALNIGENSSNEKLMLLYSILSEKYVSKYAAVCFWLN